MNIRNLLEKFNFVKQEGTESLYNRKRRIIFTQLFFNDSSEEKIEKILNGIDKHEHNVWLVYCNNPTQINLVEIKNDFDLGDNKKIEVISIDDI